MDLMGAYHQIRISDEDKVKTAFHTPYGLYQFKVMSEGLCNASQTFSAVMSRMFQQHELKCATEATRLGRPNTSRIRLGKTVLVYMDDIMAMSSSDDTKEHAELVAEILQLLQDDAFYVKLKKCCFEKKEVKYLGHIVGNNQIKVDPAKVEAVAKWPVPKNVSEVRSFNGLTCYFRKHIRAYAQINSPLTHLTKATTKWDWTPECEKAFQDIKQALITAPTLAMPDFTDPTGFEVLSDASIYGIGAVLTQHGKPIAYESKRLTPAETNWTTGDQELWAVVHALKVWRCYLEGIPFTVVTDHSPLTHLQTQPTLSRRQARWSEYLARFKFDWIYRPGRDNVADPLSRHPNFSVAILALVSTRSKGEPLQKEAVKRKRQYMQTSKQSDTTQYIPSTSDNFISTIKESYDSDSWFSNVNNTRQLTFNEGLWYSGNKVVIPDVSSLRRGVMHELHSTPYSGHMGVSKTLHAIQRTFWWPHMREHITTFVNECSSCQKNKLYGTNHHPGGKLQSLPVPSAAWESVSMDFITQLPRSARKNDAILVMVDRLTKMTHLAPCRTTIDSAGTAQLFLDHVWKLHGLPKDVISDHGSVFVGKFFSELLTLIGTKHNRSTAFHPQSDGQTERVNRVLEDTLRHFVAGRHGDWERYLPTAEFAINNALHESIKTTPFRLNYGKDPRMPITIDAAHAQVPNAAAFADRMMEGLSDAKKCMTAAQQRQKHYADRHRRDVSFDEGEYVLLSTKNIKQHATGDKSSTPKLFPKFMGPFLIEKKVGTVAYKLTLPEGMRIHPVFHVSLLKPYKSDGMDTPLDFSHTAISESDFMLERILDHKTIRLVAKRHGNIW